MCNWPKLTIDADSHASSGSSFPMSQLGSQGHGESTSGRQRSGSQKMTKDEVKQRRLEFQEIKKIAESNPGLPLKEFAENQETKERFKCETYTDLFAKKSLLFFFVIAKIKIQTQYATST